MAFKKAIEDTKYGTNFDSPEGGFDALAQVMACNVIWSTKSRRVIVLFTDSSQHVVGDGRAAGIFKPYDNECYTDPSGVYTKELEMDYPSLVGINKLASDNNVTIIFVVKESKDDKPLEPIYNSFKNVIGGSKVVIVDQNNFERITTQLREIYKVS